MLSWLRVLVLQSASKFQFLLACMHGKESSCCQLVLPFLGARSSQLPQEAGCWW